MAVVLKKETSLVTKVCINVFMTVISIGLRVGAVSILYFAF